MAARVKKNVHTCPERAGKQNFEGRDMPKADDPSIMRNILEMSKRGSAYNKQYKGLWTEPELEESIAKFFETVSELGLKPTNVALCIWLGISKAQYYEWRANAVKYGYKSDLLKQAELLFEQYLLGDVDKHTIGSIFLLKCKHDYVETNKLDVTSNGNTLSDAAEVRELISKMGLDK